MLRISLLATLAFALLACGKSAAPAAESTTPPMGDETVDPDDHGIGAAEAATMACYEDCMGTGPDASGSAAWAALSTEAKTEQCNVACASAGEGLGSDSPE